MMSPMASPKKSKSNHQLPNQRTGFWKNPRMVVALFASSSAFAVFVAMGIKNAATNEKISNAEAPLNVFSRMFQQTQQLLDENLLIASTRFLSSSPDKAPILVMGLPRSGSQAIHDFFTCNNVPSSHYCCDITSDSSAAEAIASTSSSSTKKPRTAFPCPKDQSTCGDCVLQNMQNDRPPFAGCGNYDVWSQFDVETTEPYSWFLPQHFALPLIQDAYPHATIILNRRQDAGVWADSVLHWHSITARLFKSFDLDMIEPKDLPPKRKGRGVNYKNVMKDMQASLDRALDEKDHLRKRDLLIQVYKKHLNKVRKWAQKFNHPLVEVDVDADNAGTVLAKAFGSSSSPSCWFFDAEKLDNDWKDFSFPFDDLTLEE